MFGSGTYTYVYIYIYIFVAILYLVYTKIRARARVRIRDIYTHTHTHTHTSFNPWRAPGYAPVVDPCGQAGGKLRQQHIGGDSVFTDNKVGGKLTQDASVALVY